MVSAQKIKYNGIFSNEGLGDLDIIIDVAFDSDNGAMSSYLNRSAVASESYDGRYKHTHIYKYDELFSPQFTIVKKDFSDFTQEQVRRVLKYLTSTDRPALLEVYYDGESNIVDWACIGGWTSIETYKIANSRTVGFVVQFEAITPFAISDLYTVTKTVSSTADNKIIIEVDTDDNKLVYPRITIQQNGSVVNVSSNTTYNIHSDMIPNTVYYNGTTYYWKSDVPALCVGATKPNYNWDVVSVTTSYTTDDVIENNKIYYYTSDKKYRWIDPYTFKSSTTNPNLETTGVKIVNLPYDIFNKPLTPVSMSIKNNTSSEKIVVDGANKVISSSSTRRIFGDDFVNWAWLPLYDGKNEITIEGNCEVKLEWREVRKIGEY